MEIRIKNVDTGNVFWVCSDTSLVDFQRAEPNFFAHPFGKRETYTMYRGAMIVRFTALMHTGFGVRTAPTRLTAIYLLVVRGQDKTARYPYSFCISAGADVRSINRAKRLIDKVLDDEVYAYGTVVY